FLDKFLPEDEYKRKRILYFLAETTVLSLVILFGLAFLKSVFKLPLDTEFIFLLTPPIMLAYLYFRYVFSGIEYTDLANKRDYKQSRRKAVLRSLFMGIVFALILLLIKGIPNNWYDGIDLIVLPILFTVFYILFKFITLKKSYNQNKDLLDE